MKRGSEETKVVVKMERQYSRSRDGSQEGETVVKRRFESRIGRCERDRDKTEEDTMAYTA